MDVVHRLNDIEFVWDRKKAESNLRKHGVAFETACEAFFDPFVWFIGTDVAGGERREIVIGMTADWQILRVTYVFRNNQIRVVSARRVTTQAAIQTVALSSRKFLSGPVMPGFIRAEGPTVSSPAREGGECPEHVIRGPKDRHSDCAAPSALIFLPCIFPGLTAGATHSRPL